MFAYACDACKKADLLNGQRVNEWKTPQVPDGPMKRALQALYIKWTELQVTIFIAGSGLIICIPRKTYKMCTIYNPSYSAKGDA